MHRTARHPFAAILRHEQGRSQVWLARETGVSVQYVRAVASGTEKGSPRFRAQCARVMGRPVDELFHGDSVSSATAPGETPESGSDSDRADSVVAASVAVA